MQTKGEEVIYISGFYLDRSGWKQSGNTYTKGDDVIKYDGTNWYLNGEIINSVNDIP